MNKLEKYAVNRLLKLNEVMDRQHLLSSDEWQREPKDINVIRDHNMKFIEARDEIKEIAACLLDQPADDLPF